MLKKTTGSTKLTSQMILALSMMLLHVAPVVAQDASSADREIAAEKKKKAKAGAAKNGKSAKNAKSKAQAKPKAATRTAESSERPKEGDHAPVKPGMIGGSLVRAALPQSKALQTPTANPRSLMAVKPPRSSDFYDTGTKEAEYEKLLDQEIRALFKLSQQTRTSSNRGEIWLRLAERYVEKARLVDFRAQTEYDKRVKDFLDKKTRVKPKLDVSANREYHKKAIQLYEWFVKDFPNDSKVDQALFFLGYNHFELGNTKLGEDYYRQLVSKFPESVYITESHFALGEFYFENEAWREAFQNFQKVIQARRARLASFAYYKAAWCLYRLNKTQDALKYLERVIKMSRSAEQASSVPGRKSVNKIRLAVEALKDYVPFYAESGTPEKAYDDFNRVSGDERAANQMLERFAYILADQGNRIAASDIFRQLIRLNPTGERASEYQYQIVISYVTSDAREFRKQLEVWLENFGPGSLWAQENKGNQKLVADVARLQESTLRTHVLQLHQTAQNSRAKFSQEVAHTGYQLYVKHFPDTAQIGEMQFFHAELLFDMGNYLEAARLYSFAADRDPKYKEKGMLNAVLALEKELPSTAQIDERRGKSLETLPFDPAVDQFVKAATRYIAAYPRGERVADIERRLGVIYYSYNHFEQAIPIFEKTLYANPKSENGEIAGNLILDIYKLRGDMIGFADKGQAFLANPAIASSKFGGQIRGLMDKAVYQKAEKMAENGDNAKAAREFEAFAVASKTQELAVAARFKAATSYEKAGELSAAARNYQFVLASAGNDARSKTLQNDARNALAKIYQQTGQLDLAAKQFAEFAAANSKDQKAVNGFFNAAVIWDGLGRTEEAGANYDQYRKFSKRSDRIDTFFAEAEMWRRRGNEKRSIQYYQAYLDSGGQSEERQIEATFRIADFNRRNGQATKGLKGYGQVLSMHKSAGAIAKEASVRFLAESRFQLAQATRNDLEVIRFGTTDKSQGAAAQQVQSLMKRYLEQMKDVIRLDYGPMIVAALASSGQTYDMLARKFENIQAPNSLQGEDAKKYKELIQVEVNKFKNEAKVSYQAAVDRSLEFETYGEWTKIARTGLAANSKDAVNVNANDIIVDSQAGDWMGL